MKELFTLKFCVFAAATTVVTPASCLPNCLKLMSFVTVLIFSFICNSHAVKMTLYTYNLVLFVFLKIIVK